CLSERSFSVFEFLLAVRSGPFTIFVFLALFGPLSCISRFQNVIPFAQFTIPDFLALHGASLVHFAVPIRYTVRPAHYSGFFGAVRLFSTYFWIHGAYCYGN